MIANQIQPDWISTVENKIRHIDLSKFPSFIYLDHQVIHPDKNKYLPQWAIRVDIKLEIKDRINGRRTQLINPEGVYLYSEKNFEQIIYAEIERLLVHELKECFQTRENHGSKAVIPFDPHDDKRSRIKFSTYDKIDFYRYYPTWLTATKIALSAWWKKSKSKCAAAFIKMFQNVGRKIIRFAYVEVKTLPGEGSKDK